MLSMQHDELCLRYASAAAARSDLVVVAAPDCDQVSSVGQIGKHVLVQAFVPKSTVSALRCICSFSCPSVSWIDRPPESRSNTVQFVMLDMIRHPRIAGRARNDIGQANSIESRSVRLAGSRSALHIGGSGPTGGEIQHSFGWVPVFGFGCRNTYPIGNRWPNRLHAVSTRIGQQL